MLNDLLPTPFGGGLGRGLRALIVLVLAILWPGSVLADARAELETGRNLFINGQYEQAVDVFERLLAQPLDPRAGEYKKRREVTQAARPVYAASLIAIGRSSDAERIYLDHLRDDPFYEPPPGQFPDPVVQRFNSVGAAHAEEVEALKQKILKERQQAILREQQQEDKANRRLVELEKLAAIESIVTTRSRLIALAPFGVGQLQNGNQGLAVVFAASQAVGVTSAVASLIAAQHYASAATSCDTVNCDEAQANFEIARGVNWASFGITAVLMMAGVIEAQVSLVPESRTTRRRSGPKLVVEPAAVVDRGATAIGLTARF